MATFRFKTLVTLFLIGFVSGFCTALLCFGCNKDAIGNKVVIVPVKELNKQVATIDKELQNKIVALEQTNVELKERLHTTSLALQRAKQTVSKREANIKQITNGYAGSGLAKKSDDAFYLDSSRSTPCDSLITEVNDYVEENKRKDSLYEQQIQSMDSMVVFKDHIIEANATAYNSVHQLFNKSVEQQDMLVSENLQLRKQVKRQKRKGKLYAVAGIILAGAANYFLSR